MSLAKKEARLLKRRTFLYLADLAQLSTENDESAAQHQKKDTPYRFDDGTIFLNFDIFVFHVCILTFNPETSDHARLHFLNYN